MVGIAAVLFGAAASAVVPEVAAVPSALSVLAALVSVDVAVLSSTVSAVAFVVAPSLAMLVLLFEVPACARCSVAS